MKTHVYLDSMAPDGTPGAVREIAVPEDGVRSVMAPVPYFASAPATRPELEKERNSLLAEIPNLKGGFRAKADFRLRVLEREIRRALDMEEVTRRNAERVLERKRQAIGADSPFSRNQSWCEVKAMVKASAAAVAALVRAVVKPAAVDPSRPWGAGGWPAHLKWFDDEQKKRALEMLASGDPEQKKRASDFLGRTTATVPAETATVSPSPYAPVVHAQNTCCSGQYLCANCEAKKAAVA